MKKFFAALLMGAGIAGVVCAQDAVVKKFKVNGETIKHEMFLSSVREYDGNGNVVMISDHNYVVNYIYDNNGKLVLASDNEGNSVTVTFDENGNKTKEVSLSLDDPSTGTFVETVSEYEYNDRNLRVHEKEDGLEVWYEYDDDGNCIKETNSLGSVIIYSYNEKNQVVRVDISTEENEAFQAFEYNEDGNMSCYTYNEEDWIYKEWYEFDSMGNVVYQQDSLGECIQYAYDKYGNLLYTRNVDGDCEYYENKYKKGKLIKTTVYYWEDEVKG